MAYLLAIDKQVISTDLDLPVKQFAYHITKDPASSYKKKVTAKCYRNVAF
jgi:hypothetical protein